MEKSTSSTIRLGVFVTLGVIIFTVAVYMIGQKQSMFSETFFIRAHFNNVNGLQPGNNVRFSGINVGSVTSVTILSDSLIEVRVRIKESVRQHIKQNSLATIGTDGLMGNMLLNIYPGKGDAPPVVDNYLIQSYSRIKTDDILNTLNVTNDNAAMLTHNLLDITEHIKRGDGTLSEILYDTGLRNSILQTARNLRLTTEKTNSLLQQLNDITHNIRKGQGAIGWLLTDTLTEDQVRTTLTKLENTGDHLQSVTDSIKVFIEKMKTGEGTVSALLYDTAVATDIRQTIHNLNEGTAAFQENMEALKRNFLFRKYFRKQEKAQKENN
jgi:phospholipid/cholesterol/gamma-HCH transport system substrate-binding protein